jgi:hypothetical protein
VTGHEYPQTLFQPLRAQRQRRYRPLINTSALTSLNVLYRTASVRPRIFLETIRSSFGRLGGFNQYFEGVSVTIESLTAQLLGEFVSSLLIGCSIRSD